MERPMMLLLLPALLPLASAGQIDCFLDDQECKVTSDNLIEFYMGINTSEECMALCRDDSSCTAFTHFRENNDPFPLACFLFSSCRSRTPCTNCTTGSNQADCTCSIPYLGHNSNNIVDIVASVIDEFVCKKECSANDDCDIYTFYDSEDPSNQNVCILLSATGLQSPVSACDHCATGPATCRTGQQCQVAAFSKAGISIFAKESMSLTFLAREKDCYSNMSILAVGGGGDGGDYRDYTGGGSGYVETGAAVLKTNSQVVLTVGGAQQPSSVSVDGQVVVEAKQGGDGGDSGGGNGYSGGGGYGSGDPRGGEDGGDGGDGVYYPGGQGSRLDIRQIALRDFELTPGAGGEHRSGYGGGGGGVLVNGLAPAADQYNGQGYGGGGGDDRDGNPGCVIIEL